MGGGGSKQEIRYAPYIEEHHRRMLDEVDYIQDRLTLQWLEREYVSTYPTDPYYGYNPVTFEDAFFGAGYVLKDYPTLYDMYGKFMAGLDVEVLFDQIFSESTDGPVINNLVAAESQRMSDEVEQNTLPRFQMGMRDINAVMSSTFVIGEALIEAKRVQEVQRFSAELRYKMIPAAVERWSKHLDWNKTVIAMYLEMLKVYMQQKIQVDDNNTEMKAKHLLWPVTVWRFKNEVLGTMQGAKTSTTAPQGSKFGQIAGGVMQGIGMAASFL